MSNAFVHIELTTNDVKAAKAFYRRLFDWKLADTKLGPGMTYVMVDTKAGKGAAGGGMQSPMMPGAPTGWMPYVEVADVKKSVAKAEKLGAKVYVPYQPIPGMGAMGVFADPTGAVIGVWAREAKPAPKRAAKKHAAKKK